MPSSLKHTQASALGRCLTASESLSVSASAKRLRIQEKSGIARFWGKVFGTLQDYLIIKRTVIDKSIQKVFYFSIDDGVSFSKLPAVDGFMATQAPKVRGAFSGNPAKRHTDLPESVATAEGLEVKLENKTSPSALETVSSSFSRVLTELERLAYAVESIEADTCLVLRGEYYRTTVGDILENTEFPGLSIGTPPSMSLVQLFRTPTTPAVIKRNQHQTGTSFDFLDPLEAGPYWRVAMLQGGLGITIRSLCWPGFEHTIKLGTKESTGVYFGYGESNADLEFLM